MGMAYIYVITDTSTPVGQFTLTEESYAFIHGFMKLFDIEIDKSHKIGAIEKRQEHNKLLLDYLQPYRLVFGNSIMQIYNEIRDVETGKSFALMAKNEELQEEIVEQAQIQINLLNKGVPDDKIIETMLQYLNSKNHLNTKFFVDYDYLHFDDRNVTKIGKSNKAERVCRFCGLTTSHGRTFDKEAHTIPESLGNKKIFCYEECDDCNNGIIRTIEESLGAYLHVFKTTWHTTGKKGVPQVVSKDGDLRIISIRNVPDSKLPPEYLQFVEKTGKRLDTLIIRRRKEGEAVDPLKIQWDSNFKINAQDVYRALAKIFVECIPSELLPRYTYTIEWINKKISLQRLPPVSILINPSVFLHHPEISIYLRKTDDTSLPTSVIEIKLWTHVFVAIIPISQEESQAFYVEGNFEHFWGKFYFYNGYNWERKYFVNDEYKDAQMRMSFKKPE